MSVQLGIKNTCDDIAILKPLLTGIGLAVMTSSCFSNSIMRLAGWSLNLSVSYSSLLQGDKSKSLGTAGNQQELHCRKFLIKIIY